MATTPLYRLAKHLLGEDPRTFIVAQRQDGKKLRAIAREMWLRTDGEIDVSETTVLNWAEGSEEVA